MQSEIDQSRQKYYLTCPELILRTEGWTKHYQCANCGGELDEDEWYLQRNFFKDRQVSLSAICCPHCQAAPSHTVWHGLTGGHKVWNGYVRTSVPLPFKLYWKRKHITFIPTWWQKKFHGRVEQSFYEYTELKEHIVDDYDYTKTGRSRKRKKTEEEQDDA